MVGSAEDLTPESDRDRKVSDNTHLSECQHLNLPAIQSALFGFVVAAVVETKTAGGTAVR